MSMSWRVVLPLFEKYVVDGDCVSDVLNLCMVYDGLRTACVLDNIPLTRMHVSFEAAIRTFVECNKHLGWARDGNRELIVYNTAMCDRIQIQRLRRNYNDVDEVYDCAFMARLLGYSNVLPLANAKTNRYYINLAFVVSSRQGRLKKYANRKWYVFTYIADATTVAKAASRMADLAEHANIRYKGKVMFAPEISFPVSSLVTQGLPIRR